MNDLTVAWTQNPTKGSVTGTIKTEPEPMDFMLENYNQLIVSAILADACNREWRVRTFGEMGIKLLEYHIGQKLKLTGIKGDLCKGAWNNAKRQIVPSEIKIITK